MGQWNSHEISFDEMSLENTYWDMKNCNAVNFFALIKKNLWRFASMLRFFWFEKKKKALVKKQSE